MTTYSTGTISVGAGSTSVIGVGTSWLTAGIRAGDRLIAAGLVGIIASVDTATTITLKRAWPGSALSVANYDIELVDDGVRSLVAANTLLQALGSGTLTSLGALASGANKMPYWSGAGVMAMTDLTAAARGLLDDASVSDMRTTLGVVPTTSSTDTTAGRLLKLGDFGLGAGTPPLISDFTASLRPGIYRYLEASAVGAPGTGADWQGAALVARSHTDGRVAVFATRQSTSSPRHWVGIRGGDTGALTWTEFYHGANLLGTVSQSGGLPTGSVIERRSNANGEYVRFADGTQICTNSLAAASGAAATWTFPAVFIAAPVVTGSAQATVLSAVCLDAVPTTTAATFSARDKTDARRADTCRLMAVGRWF